MNFEQLWAPWRIGYITGEKATSPSQSARQLTWLSGADESCFLCRAAANVCSDKKTQHESDRADLVVCRTSQALVMLNRYPYNNGHLLIAPAAHLAGLEQLSDSQHVELMRLITRLCGILQRLMKPEGFNIGLNLGRVAGAGLPGHLHWHVVPRWNGDTNFMPVLAGVNVIPESLEALLNLLHDEWNKSP